MSDPVKGTDAVRLRLLDGFWLENRQRRIDLPVGTQRLLALLALRGSSHRCVVAGTLWPEVPEAQALACLRTGIWRMNRLVPGVIRAEEMRLAVSVAVRVDSREQEAFTTRLLRERIDYDDWAEHGFERLRGGELLPGWYDDWVVSERERLHQLRVHALERAAQVMTCRRRLGAALELALEAVRTEPLRETANAVLISVYLAEGNVSDALRHYDLFRERLSRELGLDPSPETSRLLPRQLVRDGPVTLIHNTTPSAPGLLPTAPAGTP